MLFVGSSNFEGCEGRRPHLHSQHLSHSAESVVTCLTARGSLDAIAVTSQATHVTSLINRSWSCWLPVQNCCTGIAGASATSLSLLQAAAMCAQCPAGIDIEWTRKHLVEGGGKGATLPGTEGG